jgi:hypothetical protein
MSSPSTESSDTNSETSGSGAEEGLEAELEEPEGYKVELEDELDAVETGSEGAVEELEEAGAEESAGTEEAGVGSAGSGAGGSMI